MVITNEMANAHHSIADTRKGRQLWNEDEQVVIVEGGEAKPSSCE